jgi:hypothetical protein
MTPGVFSVFAGEMEKRALVASILAHQVNKAIANRYLSVEKDTERRKELRKALTGATRARLEPLEGHAYEPLGPHHERVDGKSVVRVRKDEDPAVLAHELGHAEFDGTLVGRALQHPATRMISNAGILVGVYAGAEGLPGSIGAAIVAASSAPTMVSEYQASSRALRLLRNAGAKEDEVADAKRKLRAAYSTYALQSSAGAADVAALAALVRFLQSRA